MKKIAILSIVLLAAIDLLAGSAPSTYFNIYVPPNNDPVQRNVALIVTAIHDSTTFSITDDNADGDNDDSVTGILMAGQSYILYIKDNGINDDAMYASGGVLTRDGDYFFVQSDKLVYASMSTDSDWQHDFVCSVNKKSVGVKFIVYAPKISSSLRDLNVFAFEDSTTITISKISQSATTLTGYTNVDINQKTVIVQKTINKGQDLIHYYTDGRNIMNTGETYMIETNKETSIQYGALFQNARDGGAYVPSSNGSSSGELFYFAVPYQAGGEQEIRIVSWDDNNSVSLDRYSNGSWGAMQNWNLDRLSPCDWVGKQNGNVTYATVFRVSCTAGKKVSVFEANWMETGSTSTSDMATMVSSESGTASGKDFLVYMLPPSSQPNVVNPFTGQFFSGSNTHLYLFAGNANTVVTIKDAKTNGQVIHNTYQIDSARYADAYFDINEWKSIYNGTGNPSGDERPYVIIESTENIAVVTANPNDNWMMYFGSSLPHSFTLEGTTSQQSAGPGDTITSYSNINIDGSSMVENPSATVVVSSGGIPVESTFVNITANDTISGEISYNENQTTITFDGLPDLTSTEEYLIESKIILSSSYNNGDPIPDGTVVILETILSGTVDGEMQQSILAQGIQNNSSNTSGLLYSVCGSGNMVNSSTDSWNGAWIDYNNDGWEDMFVTDKYTQANNQLYRNNGDETYTSISNGSIVNNNGLTVGSIWGDINNDGNIDALTVNATGKKNYLYLNDGNGTFTELSNSGIDVHPKYFHGAAFADFDSDGYLDLIITNFFSTHFHQLYQNNGDNTFSLITNTPVSLVSERSMAPILGDYNNDGLVDVYIPNGDDRPNSLFKNLGNFQFERITSGSIVTDSKSSVGAAWGDYDNDGYMDLFVANASNQNNNLYHNNGNGTFTKITQSVVTQEAGHSHSGSFMDVDNDGDLDLIVTNDNGPNFFYVNDGSGNFSRKLDEVVASDFGNSYGMAWADYNRDGSLDAMVFTHDGDNNQLFCNNGNTGNWMNVRLIGTNSNKSGIGARVKLKSNGVWQIREILPVSGFGSQNSIRAHFGIGEATSIDSLVVNWPNGYTQIITSGINKNTFITVTEQEANLLYGITFNDNNQNNQKDENEDLIGGIKMQISPSNQNICSSSTGNFQYRLADGNHTVEAVDLLHWSSIGVIHFTISPSADSVYVEVPLLAIQSGHDLKIDFATTAWRRGFSNNTVLQATNIGTTAAENATITMTYPAEVSVVSSDISYNEISAHVYEWSIDAINPGEVFSINIIDSVSLGASTGQYLMLTGDIEATGSELDQSNNSASELLEIVGAIDPNDILVFPKGERDDGYIPKQQWLTYTIRFQNVGNYYATRVTIENQLPEELDYNSLELISSSHIYNYQLGEDGRFAVAYNNINLIDSTTNEAESHGFFKYRIKPRNNLMGGEKIFNQASIVFDYEDALETNTVHNTVKYSDDRTFSLFIYPNPATASTNINIDMEHFMFDYSPTIERYEIINLMGHVIHKADAPPNNTIPISLSGITKGTFIVKAFDNKNMAYFGKLLIK